MKTAIMYYYDIESPTIYVHNHIVYLKTKNNRYIVQSNISEEVVNEIYYILNKYNKIREYYKILETKEKKLTFNYNGIQYVIIEFNKEPVKIERKVLENVKLINGKYLSDRSNWSVLWSKKVDYISAQSEKNKRKYEIIDEVIDYYIGMTETAISYLKNDTKIYNPKRTLSICHKKISNESIGNPLNIVADSKERDISEYLKYLFIHKLHGRTMTREILKKVKLNNEELKRLYARMIYPSYFFDIYDQIINQETEENKVIEIIERIDEYECYLRDIYNEISVMTNLKKVDWL